MKTTDIKTLYQIYREHPVVTTDTRACTAGSIYFALKGERFNGNQFALAALEAGCAYAVVDENIESNDERLLYVESVLEALQELAREHRRHLTIPVIGITGTNGKTTTKELLAAVLSTKYATAYTKGNFNNHIGVPLTILSINDSHEIAVVELGANHPGEIAFLCTIAMPTHALITSIGEAHLEGFGSIDGVINTKCELYDFVTSNQGKLFYNSSDSIINLVVHERYADATRIAYSTLQTGEANCRARIISCKPYLTVIYSDDYTLPTRLESQLVGSYNAANIAAAMAVGCEFEVPAADAIEAIARYSPSNNRSQLLHTSRNTLVVDAYNANPTSMAAALESFAQIEGANKIAILGDMRELGAHSAQAHARIVEQIKQMQTDGTLCAAYLVGNEFARTASSFPSFDNVEALASHLAQNRLEHATILLKGSHATALDRLLAYEDLL